MKLLVGTMPSAYMQQSRERKEKSERNGKIEILVARELL
jgi:hypothetical protein